MICIVIIQAQCKKGGGKQGEKNWNIQGGCFLFIYTFLIYKYK